MLRVISIFPIIFLVNSAQVPKCCQQGYALSYDCILSNNTLVNPYKPTNGQKSIHQPLDCGGRKGLSNLDPDMQANFEEYHLLGNSSLFLMNSNTLVPPEKYCMELLVTIDQIRPFVCFKAEDKTGGNKNAGEIMQIYSVGKIIPIPFLFVTFLVLVSCLG